jgi:hypothetical protein
VSGDPLRMLTGRSQSAQIGVERVITGSAGDNEHMIAIKCRMRLRVLDWWLSVEIEVERVLAFPEREPRSVVEPTGNGPPREIWRPLLAEYDYATRAPCWMQ